MFLLRLALLNVFRQYGRTFLSMISIVVGVAVIIMGRGFIGGSRENIIRAQIDSASGHVLAVPANYPTSGIRHPVDDLLSLDEATTDWLDENTTAWTTRTLFAPRIVKGRDAVVGRAFGFDPDKDESVFPRTDWRVTGAVPTQLEDGALFSKGLAKVLDLKPNDRVILQVRTAEGALNALQVPVSGVLTSGNPIIDRTGLFVPAPLVKNLVVNGGRFSHLAMRISDRDESQSTKAEVKSRLGEGAKIQTWQEETQALLEMQDVRQAAMDLIALALLAIAATGIANTILMAAHERIKEIGTLAAMGLTRRGVVALFLIEGMVMGIVGGAAGALLGGGFNWKLSVDGIDLSAMIEQAGSSGTYDNIPMSAMLYTEHSLSMVVGAAIVGLVIAVLASIYPALIASRLTPAEAVRAD
jgi:putative ABC transport system permease protein